MILKFSAEPTPRPPETTRRALCRSGRSDLPAARPTKRVWVGSAASTRGRFDRGVAAARGFRPRRGAHGGDHGVVGRRLDGDDRVAGVDRALERVAAFDRHHVGHLGHAEQRGDAGHQVLAEGGARAEHVACSRRRAARPAAPAPARSRCALAALATVSTLATPAICAASRGDGGRIGGEHHDVDGLGLQRLRGGHALGGGGVELAVEVFGDDQYLAHHSSPFALSAATSSAASFTITPLLRFGGGA